ncbi:hypothetical protein [Xanthomonas albilineans]|uniref:hypothetical protein n=1 Tax=Xanthomonas albilineans TaxID=29447 RepID=UPI000697A1C5|nr:hypothetical protein [Xanthomonas albilineans]
MITHGIKMSAMPIWDKADHDDPTIWIMVVFHEKLTGMRPAEYMAIATKSPPDKDTDEDVGHRHEEGDAHPYGVAEMRNMEMPKQRRRFRNTACDDQFGRDNAGRWCTCASLTGA